MAKFEEEKVITALHPENAEVGKKYWCSDTLLVLKGYVEKGNSEDINTLDEIHYDISHPFQCVNNWQFLYPYEEPPKKRMTNRQLMEWIGKGNGISKHKEYHALCYSTRTCREHELNDEVDEDIVICTWDSEEWVEPTYEVYLRDCRGSKE